MKNTIKFSKGFLPCAILSIVLIVAGIVSTAVRGINFGLDFKPGMIEEIRIAPAVAEVTYNGTNTVSVDPVAGGIQVVVSGVGSENTTKVFTYAENKTAKEIVAKLSEVEGVSAVLKRDMEISSEGLFVNSAVSTKLSSDALYLFGSDGSASKKADEVRAALSSIAGASVKELGTDAFQIRMGTESGVEGKSVQEVTNEALTAAFGKENVAIVSSDFIGSQFSSSLMKSSIILVLATLILIWVYATIRFHWDFALAAVVAIIHDSMIMIAFVSWTQVEFSTTTLAAILTIIGYSINATVVILDRVRSSMKLVDTSDFKDILDIALTATLGRSILTTLTTLFAVLALFFFTTGSIHDFALVLSIGLVSGAYSSMFISSGIIALARKNWVPGNKSTGAFVHKMQAE